MIKLEDGKGRIVCRAGGEGGNFTGGFGFLTISWKAKKCLTVIHSLGGHTFNKSQPRKVQTRNHQINPTKIKLPKLPATWGKQCRKMFTHL